MRRAPFCLRAAAIGAALVVAGSQLLYAAEPPAAPKYDEQYLVSIFPAGAQRGQTLDVELTSHDRSFKGEALGGLKDALGLVIDGPPGITVGKVENVSDIKIRASLTIAADAAPGRRMIRVRNGRTGLTNFSYFTVGTLPEVVEKEKNNEPRRAQDVTLPVVVNGRISQVLDVDCFRFSAKKGQKLVAAAMAYDFDSRTLNPRGFIDAALDLLDSEGRIVADAADVLGLDPLVETTIPADGQYIARVKLVNYQGWPTADYRLTLGETPFPTALFPVAVEQGKSVDLSVTGPNVPAGAKLKFTAPATIDSPLAYVASTEIGTHDLPVIVSQLSETSEAEPNDERERAMSLALKQGASGRFDRAGDVDWYRLSLKKGTKIRCEIHAQRYLRSPVDTQLTLCDAAGTELQQNDDLASTDVEQLHDFETFDSSFNYDVNADGEYFLRVVEQTGTFGPRAVYHLEVVERSVDVVINAWPDAVPVWGPGSTAGFIVTLDRRGAKSDVELKIEGLPDGWQGSAVFAEGGDQLRPRVIMTVTAPPDAKPGDIVEFRVVGRFRDGETPVERIAQPLTAYMASDRQFCRVSPKLRAAVGRDLGLRLSSEAKELQIVQGQNGELPVRVEPADFAQFRTNVNLAGAGFRCNLGVPQTLPVKDGIIRVPITAATLPPGVYPIVVSLAWDSETRKGMPGPCTQVVHLHVVQPTAGK